MTRKQYIFLVPGFLGFAHVGGITYFRHVRRFLGERLAAAGLEPHIHIVKTSPTSSLPVRASRVAETIHATTPRGRAPVHLIGHSSGGLDVRLLSAPGIELPTALDVARLTARVQTVTTVSTPHHGTPLASFFTTSRGQKLMQLLALSTIYVLSFGRLPLTALLWMGSFLVRFGGLVGNSGVLDELFGKLLEDFTPARRRAVRELLSDVVHDQALMLQLTPEAMEVFDASVVPRPGIRYGAVASRAPPPSLHATLHAGFDPASQVTHALYGALHRLIEAAPQRVSPELTPQQARALKRAYGVLPSPGDNDGIVPTISQTWGRVVHAAVADHLDVLGHYRDAATAPPPHRLAGFRERLRSPALRGALGRCGAFPGTRRAQPADCSSPTGEGAGSRVDAPASGRVPRPRASQEGVAREAGAVEWGSTGGEEPREGSAKGGGRQGREVIDDVSEWRAKGDRSGGPRAATSGPLEEASMLETIIIILVILWLAGLFTSYTMGGLIHLLLVIAVVVIVIRVLQGRKPLG